MYLLPDDAWAYEMTPAARDRGRMSLIVLIPDATPDDGPFTPKGSTHARVVLEEGNLPWPVLSRFLQSVDSSGDIVDDELGEVVGDLSLSCNTWRFAGRSFEVNSYYRCDHDCWCYEIYETNSANSNNEYLEVRIPDLQPVGGSFAPAAAAQVMMRAQGSWLVPWPVFRHFVNAISSSGDIIEDLPARG
ncbi:hypothetical protein [Actinoplanes sp. ATCC 53533]|uniref:hypothetical protein n=1 Tax=Actinoplanes sp. ATCC 53533 TaxID=1288362 RepID=UPI001F3925EE|nr:hypothetical protein [Actinoplanes sp. ATCC 53533]